MTDYELIRECSKRFKKLVLSTGMSTIDEIDKAVKSMGCEVGNYDSHLKRCEFALLHCNSTYPAPVDELTVTDTNPFVLFDLTGPVKVVLAILKSS